MGRRGTRRRVRFEGCGLMAGFLVLAMVAMALGYVYGNHLFQGIFSGQDVPSRTPSHETPPPGPGDPADEPGDPGDDPGDPADEPPDDPADPPGDPVDDPADPPDDPVDDPVDPPGPVTVTVTLDEPGLVRVQLGAFRDESLAEELAGRIRALGRPAYITRPGQADGLRRVWVVVTGSRSAASAYTAPLDALGEERGIYPLRLTGLDEGSITLKLTDQDPALAEDARAALEALVSFIEQQGVFWNGLASGSLGTPPVLDSPVVSGRDGEWSGELEAILEMARAGSDALADAAGRGFPAGTDSELVLSYLELVDLTGRLLSSLR